MTAPTAVLLMAYGSAPSTDEESVRRYLEHILQFYRRTSPTPEEVRHLKDRYDAVGGSPLYPVTERIAEALAGRLNGGGAGGFRVYVAMKHSPPFIEDVVRRIADDGAERAVGVALAPFRSRLSTDGYFRLVRTTNDELARPLVWAFAPDWHLHPSFLDLWEARIGAQLDEAGDTTVVFTNHSLPARIREWHDPYEGVFAETAAALAQRLSLRSWTTAFQSAGGGEEWLGPSLETVLEARARDGARRFVLAPVGFVMDHLEVRYDIDITVQRLAGELGIEVRRTEMPNDDPRLVAALADLVVRAA